MPHGTFGKQETAIRRARHGGSSFWIEVLIEDAADRIGKSNALDECPGIATGDRSMNVDLASASACACSRWPCSGAVSEAHCGSLPGTAA
jgi:hypothetical protein